MDGLINWFMEYGCAILGGIAGLMARSAYYHIKSKESVIGIICLVTALLSALFAGIMIAM